MLHIIKSPASLDDLAKIWSFVARNNIAAADRLIDEIDSKLRLLSERPESGVFEPAMAPDVHSFPVGKYLLFYRTVKDGIELIHVYHGARNLDALFEPPAASNP